MKVKMITDYHENIEEQINKFLQENKDSIDIKAYLMLQMFEKLGESLFI